MKHIPLLLVKFLISLVVFWFSFDLFFQATYVHIVSFSLLITISTYVIVDMHLLPRIGNKNAVVADFFLTYFIVFLFGAIFFPLYAQFGWGSIISATLIAGSEIFIHSHIMKNNKVIISDQHRSFHPSLAFEFAEEQDPSRRKE